MPNSRTLSLLLLLLLVSAEVIDVSARAQLGSNAGARKSSTLKRPRKRQGRRRASKEDEQRTDDKATFVADFLKKTKCDLNQLPKLFRSARKRDIKLSKSAVMQEYKTCLIEKAKEKEAEKSKDNKKDEDDQRELLTLFEDNMKTWDKTRWREKPDVYSSVVQNVKGLDGKTNYMHFKAMGRRKIP